jgi:pilus assembly protein Flp/PilA
MFAALNTQFIKAYLLREEGQAMAEYGIILALIAAVVIGTLVLLGGDVSRALTKLESAVSAAVGP